MKELVTAMKQAGKTMFLEVVSLTEEECLRGARIAVECGFDYLMGTVFFQSVFDYLKSHAKLYLPFCGKVTGFVLTYKVDSTIFLCRKSNVLSLNRT